MNAQEARELAASKLAHQLTPTERAEVDALTDDAMAAIARAAERGSDVLIFVIADTSFRAHTFRVLVNRLRCKGFTAHYTITDRRDGGAPVGSRQITIHW